MEMVRRGSAKIHSAEKAFTAKAVTRMRSITTQGVVSKTTGAVSKLGKGAASITVDATKMAMNKSLEVGKSGIAMTMDVARNAQQVALAAGSAVVNVGMAGASSTESRISQDPTVGNNSNAKFQRLIEDTDEPSIALTAAERERRKQFSIPEDEWEKCPKWLWFPVSPTRQAWDFIMLLLVLFMVVLTPYRLAFEGATGRMLTVETSIQCVFLVDVLFQFNTPYLSNGSWRVHRPSIACAYLSTWFWVDFPASVPIELVEDQLQIDDTNAEVLTLTRALRVWRLLRLLRLLNLEKWTRVLESRTGLDLSALGLIKTLLQMLFFCHILACVFYAVGVAGETDNGFGGGKTQTWINTFDEGFLVERPTPPMFTAYVIAFYWALGIVCGQNTNVTPESMPDRYVAIFVYLVGTFFLAYIIAVVTDRLRAYVADPYNMAIDDVVKFMRFHGIDREGSESLGERMKHFYAAFYGSRSMVNDRDIVGNLTPSLRFEVLDALLAKTVHACPLLQPQSAERDSFMQASFSSRALRDERRDERHRKFQEAIYWAMKPAVYKGRDTIISKHSRNRDVYFLLRGQVIATDVTGEARETSAFERMLFPLHERGCFFGEQCMLRMSSRSLMSFVAAGPIEVLCMEADALVDAANEHLDDSERLALAEQIWAEFQRKEKRHIWGNRILVADLIEKTNELTQKHGVSDAELTEHERLLASSLEAKIEEQSKQLARLEEKFDRLLQAQSSAPVASQSSDRQGKEARLEEKLDRLLSHFA